MIGCNITKSRNDQKKLLWPPVIVQVLEVAAKFMKRYDISCLRFYSPFDYKSWVCQLIVTMGWNFRTLNIWKKRTIGKKKHVLRSFFSARSVFNQERTRSSFFDQKNLFFHQRRRFQLDLKISNFRNRGEAWIFLCTSNSLSSIQNSGEKSFFLAKDVHICYIFRPSLVARGGGVIPSNIC